jgi:hypothetical protein
MFRTARRPVTTLALLLFLAPSITGCKTTQQIPFSNNAVRLDRISGVTTRSGREIRFRLPGASIVNDTMYAIGSKGEVSMPTDSISRLWNPKTSPVRTVGLITGVFVVGVAALAALSFGQSFHPFGGAPF